MLPEAGWCGSASPASNCSAGHPRASGWVNASVSLGYFTLFKSILLDTSAPALAASAVVAPVNLWQLQPNGVAYRFRLSRFSAATCPSAATKPTACTLAALGGLYPSAVWTRTGFALDAAAADPATGLTIYKATPDNAALPGRLGVIDRSMWTACTGSSVAGSQNCATAQEVVLNPSLLSRLCSGTSCNASVAQTYRFETAVALSNAIISGSTWVGSSGGSPITFVVFGGAAQLPGGYFPALLRVPSSSSALLASGGDGDEVYMASSVSTAAILPTACEGLDAGAQQGRYSSFTALAAGSGGAMLYAATSARADCLGNGANACAARAACVLAFSSLLVDGALPLAVVPLVASLGEQSATAMTVESGPSGTGNLYVAVSPTGGVGASFGRIVKLQMASASTCTASVASVPCLQRIGSYLETRPLGGFTFSPLISAIFAASLDTSAVYSRYSTADVRSFYPPYAPASSGSGTVTLMGSGFYPTPEGVATTALASCRFGSGSTFSSTAWTPATILNSTAIQCAAPAATNAAASTSGFAFVQLSFDGFPNGGASLDTSNLWQSSLWDDSQALFYYYATPVIGRLSVVDINGGSATSTFPTALITGETPAFVPAVINALGGPFIDSTSDTIGLAVCRIGGVNGTVVQATYGGPYQLGCPLCPTLPGVVNRRCAQLLAPLASTFQPLPWLQGGSPSYVSVEVSLNGFQWQSAPQPGLLLVGPPAGIVAISLRSTAVDAYPSTASLLDGGVGLDTYSISLVDSSNFSSPFSGYQVHAACEWNQSAPAPALAPASSANTTGILGSAILAPRLLSPPLAGALTLRISASFCSGGQCSAPLPLTAAFVLAISPGAPVALSVSPARLPVLLSGVNARQGRMLT